MSNQIEGFVKGIILGGLIGAAIGILYAPQSGRKTRREIGKNAEELIETAKEEYEAALKKSARTYESAIKQLKQLESSAKKKVGEMEDTVDELADLGKEALHDTKGHLAKAVNAAVQAFR